MLLEPQEIPELSLGRNTVNIQSIYLSADESRATVFFREACNGASFPLADITKNGKVVFSGADGLARLRDFLSKADLGPVQLEAGEATAVSGTIEGSYVEKAGYHNWSLTAWKRVG